jgi:translation initiation factor IF-3
MNLIKLASSASIRSLVLRSTHNLIKCTPAFQNYTTDDSDRGVKKPNIWLKQKVEPKPEIYYKTPFNRGKVFSPTTINVGKGIKHLIVNLFDETDRNLGNVSLEAADKLAHEKELKLVIVDEACSPVKFKLMNGADLYALQLKFREDNKEAVKVAKRKEVVFRLGIEDNDFDIKLKMIQQFYEKGNIVDILVKSQINKKSVE